jgi:hypothetical protein
VYGGMGMMTFTLVKKIEGWFGSPQNEAMKKLDADSTALQFTMR